VAPQPKDLLDRRVELPAPRRKDGDSNALNSGASTFMADFEDANCPTWRQHGDGQSTCATQCGAPQLEQSGKRYRLQDEPRC